MPQLIHGTAAGLNITEPASTGIGGDVFCLYYDAQTKKISALNGSGRAGGKCTLETIRKSLGLADGDTGGKIDMQSVHAVTVPGAPAGWCDTVERFGSGKLTMEQILAPAIELGERGFPVAELVTHYVCYSLATRASKAYTRGEITWCLGTKSLSDVQHYSGKKPSPSSALPRPTSARCSKTTRARPTACGHRGRARL